MTAARRSNRCRDFASVEVEELDAEGRGREKVWGVGERGDL